MLLLIEVKSLSVARVVFSHNKRVVKYFYDHNFMYINSIDFDFLGLTLSMLGFVLSGLSLELFPTSLPLLYLTISLLAGLGNFTIGASI